MMRRKNFWVLHLLLFINIFITFSYENILAKEKKQNEKVIYLYKKNQRVDLGEINVKGKGIVPGDLTIRERKRHNSKEDIFEKKDFEKEIKEDFIFFTRSVL